MKTWKFFDLEDVVLCAADIFDNFTKGSGWVRHRKKQCDSKIGRFIVHKKSKGSIKTANIH